MQQTRQGAHCVPDGMPAGANAPRRVPAAPERAPQGSDFNLIRIKPWAANTVKMTLGCEYGENDIDRGVSDKTFV